ncbi:MAG TPA: chorismate lyase [Methylophilaceae bacterium]
MHSRTLLTHSVWMKLPVNSGAYRRWLTDRGSLTRRLQSLCEDFRVRTGGHRFVRLQSDEARLLRLSCGQHALLREVELICDGNAAVYACSVLPRRSLKGEWRELGRLGDKPLGMTLFMNPRVMRTQMEFKKLSRQHALCRRAVRHLDAKPRAVWARRSIFRLRRAAIMVTEVFLPSVLSLSEHE